MSTANEFLNGSIESLWNVPYGEEEERLLGSISLEEALSSSSWTLQLRLALRVRPFSTILIPHVWKRVSCLTEDDDDEDDKWKQDYMIRHWSVTRHHIQDQICIQSESIHKSKSQLKSNEDCYRYSNSFIVTLQNIIQRIDQLLLLDMDAADTNNIKTCNHHLHHHQEEQEHKTCPIQTVMDAHYRSKTSHHDDVKLGVESSLSPPPPKRRKLPSLHANFQTFVTTQVPLKDGQHLLKKLCHHVACHRHDWFRHESWNKNNMPIHRLVISLPEMELCNNDSDDDDDTTDEILQGRILLLSWLKSQGNTDLKLCALPESLLLWRNNNKDGTNATSTTTTTNTMYSIMETYLRESKLPNGNALMACLWAHRGQEQPQQDSSSTMQQLLTKFQAWLPTTPILSLARRYVMDIVNSKSNNINNDPLLLQSSMEFITCLDLTDEELQSIFEPLINLGQQQDYKEVRLLGDCTANELVDICNEALQKLAMKKQQSRHDVDIVRPTLDDGHHAEVVSADHLIQHVWGHKKAHRRVEDVSESPFEVFHEEFDTAAAALDGASSRSDEDDIVSDSSDDYYIDETDHRILLL